MSKRSRRCCKAFGLLGPAAVALLLSAPARPQFAGFSAASVEPSAGVTVSGPGPLRVPVSIRIRRGYHINSSQPNDPYLIPTVLTWDDAPLRVGSITYPPPEEVRYEFSDKPLSVYSGRVEIVTTFEVSGVPSGAGKLSGSFRFQACNDEACLPPRTRPVTVPLRSRP